MIEDFFSPQGKVQLRKAFWIFFGIMILIWAGVGIPYTNQIAKNNFKEFNSASIVGRISRIEPTKSGVVLSVAGKKFAFSPIADRHLNDYKSFAYLATVNDSVVKKSYADTLFLFTKNGLYKYTFSKY